MMTEPSLSRVGVVLMTYGSPQTLDDVPGYLRNVYGGREPSDEVVAEFKRRYELIGGSPLLRVTQEQAAALEVELARRHPDGPTFVVTAGMRFFAPFVADVVPAVAEDADALVGVIMSPQYSPILMRGYITALRDAVAPLGRDDLKVAITEDWHMQPDFLQAVADRVREALDRLPDGKRVTTPVLLSAHSMPLRVVADEPDYIDNLKQTAAAIAERAGLRDGQWQFCYQSAGHTPEPWLKPDFADLMPELKAKGATDVLIAPVQFLSDHLEILYDIEVGAREQAEEHGIVFHRTQSLNSTPLFIEALASVVEDALTRAAPLERTPATR
ncbi:MAG TPA: ferrochelatase [Ktedonobacterales bacterium]|nr:ferrochelatase [Ktedonobacterales bacterium]